MKKRGKERNKEMRTCLIVCEKSVEDTKSNLIYWI